MTTVPDHIRAHDYSGMPSTGNRSQRSLRMLLLPVYIQTIRNRRMDRRTSGRADGSLPQMRYRLCNWIKLRIFNYHGVFGTHVRSLVLSSLLEQCREGHMTRVSTRMLRAGYAPRSAREFTKSTLEGLEGTNRMKNSDRISLLTSAASWIEGESLRTARTGSLSPWNGPGKYRSSILVESTTSSSEESSWLGPTRTKLPLEIQIYSRTGDRDVA